MIRRAVAAFGALPASQRVLRSVVLLGPVVALLASGASGAAGDGPPSLLVVVVVALAAVFAVAPGPGAGALVMVVVVVWWALVPGDALHPAVLLAAAALLAAHVAALLVSAAPSATPVDTGVTRRWVGRGATVLVAAPVLWALALALRDDAAPSGSWPVGLGAVLVAVVAAAAAFPSTARPR